MTQLDGPAVLGGADLSVLHVVVPLRGVDSGKSRLGQALDAEERGALVLGLLARTLDVLAAWPQAQRVYLVTGDAANELLPVVLDNNVHIAEYKTATCASTRVPASSGESWRSSRPT